MTSLCALHSLDPSEMFTELYREEKREEGDRGGQENKREESKGERQIQPVISSLDWKKHKLESKLRREISITSDVQITPSLWQEVKKN